MKNLFVLNIVIYMSLLSTWAVGAEPLNYEDHIKPMLREHCLKCHNTEESKADLDLSTFAALTKGGSSGPVVRAGRPESSLLYRAISHLEGTAAMPPESPRLADDKLALVRDWIRSGMLAGKGAKSQLRNVEMMLPQAAAGAELPIIMPESLPAVTPIDTARPPVPQAFAVSPVAPLIAVSGQEQILLYKVVSVLGTTETPPSDALDTSRLKLLGMLPFAEGTIHDLRFNSNGSLLLAAGGRGAHSGRVVLFDVKSGKRIAEIGDEVDAVLAADISSDLRFVALGGPGKVVKVFDVKSGEQLYRLTKHTDWITAIAFSPDGKLLATGDRSGGIHVWESQSGAIVYTLDEHKVRVTALDWRSDGKLLASSAEDGMVILWDTKDGWPTRNISAHTAKSATRYTRYTGVLSVRFSKDGRMLTAGRDRAVRLWDAEGNLLQEFKSDSLPLSAAFVVRTGIVISSQFDGTVKLWDCPILR